MPPRPALGFRVPAPTEMAHLAGLEAFPALRRLAAELRGACAALRAACPGAEVSAQWLLEARTPLATTPVPQAPLRLSQ